MTNNTKVRRRQPTILQRAVGWLTKHRVIVQAVLRFVVGVLDAFDRYLDTLDDDEDEGPDSIR